jgi:hypothetical protein
MTTKAAATPIATQSAAPTRLDRTLNTAGSPNESPPGVTMTAVRVVELCWLMSTATVTV